MGGRSSWYQHNQHKEAAIFRGVIEYIVTAPIMSTGVMSASAFESLLLNMIITSVSAKIGDSPSVAS